MYTRLPHPTSLPASGASHPVRQTASISDRRAAAQRQAALIGAIRKSTPEQTVPSGPPVQRLVLKYGGGGMDSIDKDSQIIAEAQDATRSRPVIPVQNLFHINDSIYPLMDDQEPIYIVSHGRAAMGGLPAVLEQMAGRSEKDEIPADGKIRTTGEKARFNIDGAKIAQILQMIRSKLQALDKEIGPVKIEACMSAMRRTTKGKRFGFIPRLAEPSLIDDIQKNLPEEFPAALRGNTGFAAGTEFSPGGVRVTDKKHTELGLLANMLELLTVRDAFVTPQRAHRRALFDDARQVTVTYRQDLSYFDRYLAVKAPGQGICSYDTICDFLTKGSTEDNRDALNIIITCLSDYAKMDTSLYESFLYGLTEKDILADLLYHGA